MAKEEREYYQGHSGELSGRIIAQLLCCTRANSIDRARMWICTSAADIIIIRPRGNPANRASVQDGTMSAPFRRLHGRELIDQGALRLCRV